MEKQSTPEFEDAYKRLINWADALKNATEQYLPQIREALDPNHQLPEGCPSRGSLADLIFDQIRSKQNEVNAAIKDVEKAIRKIGG